jgi:hypothetical protein
MQRLSERLLREQQISTFIIGKYTDLNWEELQAVMWSRVSVVGTATAYGLDDRGVGVRVPVGSRIFSSPRRPDQLWVHSTTYPMGAVGSFAGDKAAGA